MALKVLMHRKPPSWWQRLANGPVLTLARLLQSKRSQIAMKCKSASATDAIAVACVSDTHNRQPELPPGDLLIHAGDLPHSGTFDEVQAQLEWIDRQPHAPKIVIAGNHDLTLGPRKKTHELGRIQTLSLRSTTYLQDSSVRLRFRGGRSLLIHGSPWTEEHGMGVYQFAKGTDMFSNRLKEDVDISGHSFAAEALPGLEQPG